MCSYAIKCESEHLVTQSHTQFRPFVHYVGSSESFRRRILWHSSRGLLSQRNLSGLERCECLRHDVFVSLPKNVIHAQEPFTMDFPNIEVLASEGIIPLPQNSSSEPTQHFTPSPSEKFPGSLWQALPHIPPPQAGGRSPLPSLPPPPGTSSYPQNAMADNGTGRWNPHCEGTNGAEAWLAGYVSSFPAVPEIPPVCSNFCTLKNLLTSKQHSRFIPQ